MGDVLGPSLKLDPCPSNQGSLIALKEPTGLGSRQMGFEKGRNGAGKHLSPGQ
jgi:hypothetical protein